MSRRRNGFVERPNCPSCGMRGISLISIPYDDARISDFVASYYGQRVPMETLCNVRYHIDRCDHCGLLWQRWMLDEEGMQQLYEEWISPDESLAKKTVTDTSLFTRYAREMEAISDLCGAEVHRVSVFDFGMGWGYWCRMAQAYGYETYGYDISALRIMHASKMGIHVIQDLEELKNLRFDFINCEQVLEHIAYPATTLQLLVNSLTKDGKMRISVPDGSSAPIDLADPAWRAAKDALHPLEHINTFSHTALTALAEGAGLAWLCDASITTPNSGTCLFFSKQVIVPATQRLPAVNKHQTSPTLAENLCCIVRSVAERSTVACRRLIALELGMLNADDIQQVGEKPFPETLADSYRAGIEAGRKWTLCIDGDVLPFPGAICAMIEQAEMFDETAFEIQGLVFDRLFGGWRPAGIHLYRTALLPRALELIDQIRGEIRPETALLDCMAKKGFPWHQTGLAFGLHDFEQFPQDLSRKCFVHAWKHVHFIPRMLDYWRMRREERDFDAALQGLAAGIAYSGKIELDWRHPCYPTRETYVPLPDNEVTYVIHVLEQEQTVIRGLGFRQAPVWDWAENFHNQPGWLKMLWHGLAKVVERGVRSLVVKGDNPVIAAVIGKEAREWGLTVLHAEPWWSAPVASLDAPMLSFASSGSLQLHYVGERVEIVATMEATNGVPTEYEITSKHLIDRLARAGVDECLVYGAGEVASAFHKQAVQANVHIHAFLVSELEKGRDALFDVKILPYDQGVADNPCRDVVVASYGSAKEMVRRVILTDKSKSCRIWCLR